MHEGQEDLHRTYAGQRFCEAMPTKDAPASLAACAACGWVCLCVCVDRMEALRGFENCG